MVTLEILLEFLKLSFFSLLIGIAMGFSSALLYKKVRILTLNTLMETVILFCFAYLSYCIAELFHLSGIISLLSCGIMMGHYTWYNLSPQAMQTTSVAFSVVGYAFEAFVFGYLGLTFFSYAHYSWSWELIIAEIFIVLFGRFTATIGIIKIFE